MYVSSCLCLCILLCFSSNLYMRENMWPLSFRTWLISLHIMISSSIYLPANDIVSFFFISENYSIMYVYHIFLIHSLVVGHLGYFHGLAVVNSAAINMDMQVSLLYRDLHSFEYLPRRGLPRSYGHSIFSFLRNFHNDYTNLHSHQCMRIHFPSYHH
jgi:hypothetical protein